MQYLLIHTPPDKYNSEYTAHLLEHAMLGDYGISDFFSFRSKILGNSYTHYTIYTIASDDPKILNEFLYRISETPPIALVNLEKQRISDEQSEYCKSKKIVEKIGKYFIGKDYKFARNERRTYEEFLEYYNKYYKRESIKILSSAEQYYTTPDNISFNWSSWKFRFDYEDYLGVFLDFSSEAFFVMSLLEEFYDSYFEYLDSKNGRYWVRNIQEGESLDKVWLTFQKTYTEDMKRIPEEFFSGFIQQKLHDYQSKDLHEYDLLSFLYYESVLSFEAKTFHLKKLSDYHNVIITL